MKFELKMLPRDASLEEIISEIKRVAVLIKNEKISQKEFNRYSKISAYRLCIRFGSWENVFRISGLENRYNNITISDKVKKQGFLVQWNSARIIFDDDFNETAINNYYLHANNYGNPLSKNKTQVGYIPR